MIDCCTSVLSKDAATDSILLIDVSTLALVDASTVTVISKVTAVPVPVTTTATALGSTSSLAAKAAITPVSSGEVDELNAPLKAVAFASFSKVNEIPIVTVFVNVPPLLTSGAWQHKLQFARRKPFASAVNIPLESADGNGYVVDKPIDAEPDINAQFCPIPPGRMLEHQFTQEKSLFGSVFPEQ